jgi:hypothetical protein
MITRTGVLHNFCKTLVVITHLQIKHLSQVVLIAYIQLGVRNVYTAA